MPAADVRLQAVLVLGQVGALRALHRGAIQWKMCTFVMYRVANLLADYDMLTSVPYHIEVILRQNWCQHNIVH